MEISQIENNVFLISDTELILKDSFECGQCFRWKEDEKGYIGVAKNKLIRVIQSENGIILENTNIHDINTIWLDYFDLNTSYSDIIKNLPDDSFLQSAAAFGRGIHILRQDPFEALISFIISANNNITRIKGIVERLCVKYGKPIIFEGKTYYSFPSPSELSGVTLSDLSFLNAGYRDKYLLDAFQKLNGEIDIEELLTVNSAELKKVLLTIKGVGPKVCDCVMLFGFARYECFPKDVWIKRVINSIYGDDFDEKSFGEYAGVIQQYLFHYARNGQKKELHKL